VSLLETRRKAERDAREKATLENKNRFRAAHGMAPVTEKEDTDPDAEPDEKEQEAIKRIQVDEAARILSDYIGTERPLTAMH
jgi:carboxyl-terminal processing protease